MPVDYKWQQIVTEEILGLEIAKCRRKRKIVKELNKPSNLIVMKGDGNCFFQGNSLRSYRLSIKVHNHKRFHRILDG